MNNVEEEIVRILEENPNAFFSIKEISKKLSLNKEEVSKCFDALLTKKKIFRVDENNLGTCQKITLLNLF